MIRYRLAAGARGLPTGTPSAARSGAAPATRMSVSAVPTAIATESDAAARRAIGSVNAPTVCSVVAADAIIDVVADDRKLKVLLTTLNTATPTPTPASDRALQS
eukprot:3216753-Prymnesium_polylepis.1